MVSPVLTSSKVVWGLSSRAEGTEVGTDAGVTVVVCVTVVTADGGPEVFVVGVKVVEDERVGTVVQDDSGQGVAVVIDDVDSDSVVVLAAGDVTLVTLQFVTVTAPVWLTGVAVDF